MTPLGTPRSDTSIGVPDLGVAPSSALVPLVAETQHTNSYPRSCAYECEVRGSVAEQISFARFPLLHATERLGA